MNEVKYILLCDHHTVDATGKMSHIGIFQTIRPKELPASIPRFFLVAVIDNPDFNSLQLKIVSPSGKPIIDSAGLPFKTLGQDGTKLPGAQLAMQIENMAFPESGEYKVSLIVDNRILGEVPLIVEEPKVDNDAIRDQTSGTHDVGNGE